MEMIGKGKKLEVSKAQNLKGGIVYLDALFNAKTTPRKLELEKRLVELSGNNLGLRMSGSNIDQQRQVAAGRAELTLTDAVGGFFDLAAGALIIKEAGGEMIDAQTGEPVTEKTQVAIGGPKVIVAQIKDAVKEIYSGYQGFK